MSFRRVFRHSWATKSAEICLKKDPMHFSEVESSGDKEETAKKTGQKYRNVFRRVSIAVALKRPLPKLTAEEENLLRKKLNQLEKIKPPPGLPPAVSPHRLRYRRWDFWEWWGIGTITGILEKEHSLECGDPLSYETGWDLNDKAHVEAAFKLREEFGPQVLGGWIDCKLWTVALRAANYLVREYMRTGELMSLYAFSEACLEQCREGLDGVLENPKRSEYFLTEMYQIIEDLPMMNRESATHDKTHMCRFDLKDKEQPELLFKKETAMKASFKLKHCTKLCKGHKGRPHGVMEGNYKW